MIDEHLLVPRLTRKQKHGKSLRRARAGHIGTITCVEKRTRQIFEKDPSSLTTLELATLRCSLTKCQDQQTKIEALNQQINEAMTAAEVREDAFEEEKKSSG